MAAPNLTSISTITAKSLTIGLTTTGLHTLENPSSSNKVFKVNSIVIGNIDGTNAATINVRFDKSGVSAIDIFRTISVPANSSLVLIDRNSSIYLEEGDVLLFTPSANNDLVAMINYEEIS
tara:strand:- start:215 stop:577 length:363 start_codon:yes stop_codon:yes gene_type:complete